MKIDKALCDRLKIKQTSAEDIIEQVKLQILKNTPKSLHKRIEEKIEGLCFCLQRDLRSSEFKHENKTIYINQNHVDCFDVYLHEIMHAIGCEIKEDKTIIGLNARYLKYVDETKDLFINFGYGANEGLNQHYTESFLPTNIKKSEIASSYSFCANIMASLERIIGEDILKHAHFSGSGVFYLINKITEKCKLPNDNKPVKLILQLDAFQKIAQTHAIFGAVYSTDSRVILTQVYKSLITLAIICAKNDNRDIYLSEIISDEHLTKEDFVYLTKYILKDLTEYFYKEKEHIFSKTGNSFVGMQLKPFLEYSEMIMQNYAKTSKMQRIYLPEEVRCGELFNHIFLNCMFYDKKHYAEGIYTNDFKRELTVAIFDTTYCFMPNYLPEKAQLVKQIFSSKNVVRSGAEICDDYIIECCKDLDFNYYLIDTMPDYYKEIFPQICDDAKKDITLVKKLISDVFTSRVERYKFIKNMPKEALDNKEIIKLLNQNNNSSHTKNRE